MSQVQRYQPDAACRLKENDGPVLDGDLVFYADYALLEEKALALQSGLDRIESQRRKWRKAKRRARAEGSNPLRYDPKQSSIYGDDHVQELASQPA